MVQAMCRQHRWCIWLRSGVNVTLFGVTALLSVANTFSETHGQALLTTLFEPATQFEQTNMRRRDEESTCKQLRVAAPLTCVCTKKKKQCHEHLRKFRGLSMRNDAEGGGLNMPPSVPLYCTYLEPHIIVAHGSRFHQQAYGRELQEQGAAEGKKQHEQAQIQK
eukprot:1150431-Pelagomonas_calceolata.AAC.7